MNNELKQNPAIIKSKNNAKLPSQTSSLNLQEDIEVITDQRIDEEILNIKPFGRQQLQAKTHKMKQIKKNVEQKQIKTKQFDDQSCISDIESECSVYQRQNSYQILNSNVNQPKDMVKLEIRPVQPAPSQSPPLKKPLQKKNLDIKIFHDDPVPTEDYYQKDQRKEQDVFIHDTHFQIQKQVPIISRLLFEFDQKQEEQEETTDNEKNQTLALGSSERTPQQLSKKFCSIEYLQLSTASPRQQLRLDMSFNPNFQTERIPNSDEQKLTNFPIQKQILLQRFLTGENYPQLYSAEKRQPNLINSRIKYQVHTLDNINSLDLDNNNNTLMNLLIPGNIVDNERSIVPPNLMKKNVTCNCKQTQCTKLYCDCFNAGQACNEHCKCQDCNNKNDQNGQREQAISHTKAKNPNAFKSKIEYKQDTEEQSDSDKLVHNKGCNCRKSNCQKQYCECYNTGVWCSDKCKCLDCQNMELDKRIAATATASNLNKVKIEESNFLNISGGVGDKFEAGQQDFQFNNFIGERLPVGDYISPHIKNQILMSMPYFHNPQPPNFHIKQEELASSISNQNVFRASEDDIQEEDLIIKQATNYKNYNPVLHQNSQNQMVQTNSIFQDLMHMNKNSFSEQQSFNLSNNQFYNSPAFINHLRDREQGSGDRSFINSSTIFANFDSNKLKNYGNINVSSFTSSKDKFS